MSAISPLLRVLGLLTFSRAIRVHRALCFAGIVFYGLNNALGSPAETQFTNQWKASELGGMEIEQLMTIRVTTVSRKTEPIANAAAAIQVISPEDIRRS